MLPERQRINLAGRIKIRNALAIKLHLLATVLRGLSGRNKASDSGADCVDRIFDKLICQPHAHALLDGPFGQELLNKFATQGMVALAWGVFAAGAIQMIVQWVALTRLGQSSANDFWSTIGGMSAAPSTWPLDRSTAAFRSATSPRAAPVAIV